MRTLLLSLVASLVLAPSARADEGMWTYNNFPKAAVKQKYKVDVTDQWLAHLRLSSVRFNNGGSGSFVSPTGLVMTNHHIGADCINKLAKSDKDLIKNGFYAKTRNEEMKCPDLELDVLVDIADVTKDVQSVAKAGMDDAAINEAQKEKMSAIEKECSDRAHNRCDVVTLYHGGVYNLYTYRKYTDVRLVFAPELQIAFFGGDHDNFEFPRYDLDVAYFRVYDGGIALSPDHYLKWSPTGARDGELVFVSGNPGRTSRLDTVAELQFARDFGLPLYLERSAMTKAALEAYSARGPEQARQAERRLFDVMNGIKAVTAREAGLEDDKIMSKKIAEEEALKKQLADKPEYAKVWDHLAAVEKKWVPMYRRYELTEQSSLGSQLMGFANEIVRLVAEKGKPNGERLREYRDSALPSLELGLFSPAPIYPELDEALLTATLEWTVKSLGADDPYVKKVLGGKTPAARAHELVTGTKLTDPAFRQQLAASKDAVAKSNDPMIVLARALDPERRALRKIHDDTIEAVERHNHEVLARGMFAARGTSMYPDATFTLRLSYGKVAGYMQDGKRVPAMTNIAGLYDRSKKAEDKAPWDLPPHWVDAKTKVNGKVPMNFVSTNDIIPGNSGSPTVNARGEVVGLIFDGNIQFLVGNFIYDEAQNRAVSVHSAALIEALRHVYDAGPLADELQALVGKKHASR